MEKTMRSLSVRKHLLYRALAFVAVSGSFACTSNDGSSGDGEAGTSGTNAGATGGAGSAGSATGGSATGGSATAGSTTGGSATAGSDSGGASGTSTGGSAGSTGGTGGSTAGASGSAGTAGTGGTVSTGGTAGTGASSGSSGAGGSGTCAGVSAAFAPITSYTARDGGFGPAVATRNTGDASLGTDANGVANKVAIFRPAADKYGQGGVRHPIIVWGNGSTNTVDIWQGFLSRVATYGFVVVAPEQTQVTADHMNEAIDYVLALANDGASGDCGKIDTTKIGSTGYSRGGGGAISVGSDARITSTFFFASNGNVRNLKAPWGVIGGDMDTTFNWTAISSAVTGSMQPAFGGVLAGIDHNRVAGNAKAQEAYIAWTRWRFMGDPAGKALFAGAACQICTDSAFSGFVKTSTFDSL